MEACASKTGKPLFTGTTIENTTFPYKAAYAKNLCLDK